VNESGGFKMILWHQGESDLELFVEIFTQKRAKSTGI